MEADVHHRVTALVGAVEDVLLFLGALVVDRPPLVLTRHRVVRGEGEEVGVVERELATEGHRHAPFEEGEHADVRAIPHPVAGAIGTAGPENLVRVRDVRGALVGPEEHAVVVGLEAEVGGHDPRALDLVLEPGLILVVGVGRAGGGEDEEEERDDLGHDGSYGLGVSDENVDRGTPLTRSELSDVGSETQTMTEVKISLHCLYGLDLKRHQL